MKLVIAGGTGFIGRALVNHYVVQPQPFLGQAVECVVIGRNKEKIQQMFNQYVIAKSWDEVNADTLLGADLIINLAGTNIGEKRWTPVQKEEIMCSRVRPTKTLAQLCAMLGEKSPPLFNASGAGIYGLQPNLPSGLPPALDETTPINPDPTTFMAKVGQEWEGATQVAKDAGIRVVNMRFGVVLANSGGALSQLKRAFTFFLGGPIGSGEQAFPWIALPDLIRAIDFLREHKEIKGPVNFVAPDCISEKEFAHALAKALHRPCWLPVPASLLKLSLGEMAKELLLYGQHVKPAVLLQHGFTFLYPNIRAALNGIFTKAS